MEFIRRNIGFLLLWLISLLLAGGLAFLWFRSYDTAATFEGKVKGQKDFMAQVKRMPYGLNQPNVEVAGQNRVLAEAVYKDFQRLLVMRYGVPTEKNITGLDCVRQVKESCRTMQQALLDKGIVAPADLKWFSFDSVATSSTLPTADEVPLILKQLRIVEEVMRLVTQSSLTDLRRVSRTTGLQPIAKAQYSMTCFELSVSGSYRAIERFVNQVQRESKGIFIVRTTEISTGDQAASGQIASLSSMAPTAGPAAGAIGPGGMPPEMMMPGPGWNGGNMPPPRMVQPGAKGEVNKAVPAKTELKYIDLTKDQRTVFKPHDMQALIVVDFVEFKKPAEEK